MTDPISKTAATSATGATAALVLADGKIYWGRGLGKSGQAIGEICFNTAMTGYQETLTDPSFAGQIVTFTFPHIGNVGANSDDIETIGAAARGLVLAEDITKPANWRAQQHLDAWLKGRHLVGISGVDTRQLTRHIRDNGPPNGIVCHAPDGHFDIPTLLAAAKAWQGLEGMDLVPEVGCKQSYSWAETCWTIGKGYGRRAAPARHIIAIDYGIKRNILRCLASTGSAVTVMPATASAAEILAHKPDGIFLSNGPGDPAATGLYAVPTIQALINRGIPIFGICLGHQILALALGGRTEKMTRGHRGANHPVKDLMTGKVEITSQNHGFQVIGKSLPANAEITHISLFDGSNEGFRLNDRPIFSVQYHPEASPGPQDSQYLFDRFVQMIDKAKHV